MDGIGAFYINWNSPYKIGLLFCFILRYSQFCSPGWLQTPNQPASEFQVYTKIVLYFQCLCALVLSICPNLERMYPLRTNITCPGYEKANHPQHSSDLHTSVDTDLHICYIYGHSLKSTASYQWISLSKYMWFMASKLFLADIIHLNWLGSLKHFLCTAMILYEFYMVRTEIMIYELKRHN